jgi:hypothetical protein
MQTNQATEPCLWTIRYGKMFPEDTDDEDFSCDEESDITGLSSDLESIASGDNEIIAKARTEKSKKEAREAKARQPKVAREAMQARATKEAFVAKERQAHAAKEREARAAEEQEAHATEEEAHAAEEEEAHAAEEEEARAAEENEERSYAHCIHILPIDFVVYPRQETSLTDGQVAALQQRLPKFRLANPDTRTTIIQDVVSELESSWSHDMDFDRDLVETVRTLSADSFPSHTFVDCLQIFI